MSAESVVDEVHLLRAYSVMDRNASAAISRPNTLNYAEHTEDGIAAAFQPSWQVDYFSHNWVEEDIWWSWRYIVRNRGKFTSGVRLKNASWRA